MNTNSDIIKWAEEQASSLLAPLENRWKHTLGVVEQAYVISKIFNEDDRSLLIAAAYLHDIGYAPSLNKTGFHPLDGAFYLQPQSQERLVSLIAYHSEAQFEARLRGLLPELSKFRRECSDITDALTYCDMTTDSTGERVLFQERIEDIFSRYDETHIVHQAIQQAIPSYAIAIERTQAKLDIHENSTKRNN